MNSTPKLTKKQKKALAFRERSVKGKGKATASGLDEENDFPVLEDQNRAEAEVDDRVVDVQKDGTKTAPGYTVSVEKKKRKQVEADETDAGRKAKKRKTNSQEVLETTARGDAESSSEQKSNGKGKKDADKRQRFILFVGNLKYTTSKETIQEHFKTCDPPPDVRLITPKIIAGKPTTKSKGCAFLEFSEKGALQQALRLHHSQLEGRMINVELTAGGGGKSEGRMAKLKERNKELYEQRKKKLEKQKDPSSTDDATIGLERPQRYSATSGVDQAPTKRRTWSVADDRDNKDSKSRGKKTRRPPKSMGTGVNAIPVG